MDYNIINSGSDGNATIVNHSILIDCGVTFKQLKPYYKDFKIVLLTHQHIDHFNKKTIKKLAEERPILRFACGPWLLGELLNCGVNFKNIDVLLMDTEHVYTDFTIIPFKLFHDVSQCGYKIHMNDKKLIYATDTKTMDGIEAKDYDVYLIEANYTEDEINERIREKISKKEYVREYRVMDTHLSKEQATEWLLNNMGDNSIYEFMHVHKEK